MTGCFLLTSGWKSDLTVSLSHRSCSQFRRMTGSENDVLPATSRFSGPGDYFGLCVRSPFPYCMCLPVYAPSPCSDLEITFHLLALLSFTEK